MFVVVERDQGWQKREKYDCCEEENLYIWNARCESMYGARKVLVGQSLVRDQCLNSEGQPWVIHRDGNLSKLIVAIRSIKKDGSECSLSGSGKVRDKLSQWLTRESPGVQLSFVRRCKRYDTV